MLREQQRVRLCARGHELSRNVCLMLDITICLPLFLFARRGPAPAAAAA